MVKVGDSIPSVPLTEGAPDAQVDLSKEFGSGVIIGVPAAFSKFSATEHRNPSNMSQYLY
jgi:2-Cys peroxiredoxin 5